MLLKGCQQYIKIKTLLIILHLQYLLSSPQMRIQGPPLSSCLKLHFLWIWNPLIFFNRKYRHYINGFAYTELSANIYFFFFQLIIKDQDEQLDMIGTSVGALKNMSHQIGNELEEQNRCLN